MNHLKKLLESRLEKIDYNTVEGQRLALSLLRLCKLQSEEKPPIQKDWIEDFKVRISNL